MIKNCRAFLCAPEAIYKTERCICHVLEAWSWVQGHNVKYHIIYCVPPGWVRTDKKDTFAICYICGKSTEVWGSQSRRERKREVRRR